MKKLKKRLIKKLVIIGVAFGLLSIGIVCEAQAANTVTLAWNASPSTGITNYTLYVGTVSGTYASTNNAGTSLTKQLSGFTAGTQYFFNVTCTDNHGITSVFGGEINYVVPFTAPLPPTALKASSP